MHHPSEVSLTSCQVTNTGNRFGTEVVLAFFRPSAELSRAIDAPVVKKQLFDYERVALHVGEAVTLRFTVNTTTLALSGPDGNLAVYPGQYAVVFSRGHGRELTAMVDATRGLDVGYLVPGYRAN